MPDVQLETARLILRPTRREDFDTWAAIAADSETARFIGGVQPRAAAWRSFLCMAGAWQIQGFGMFSLLEKASGNCVGRLGPWQPEGWPGTEVGWALARASWGKGYATEAGVAAIDWAFDALGWDEVIHCIDPLNVPSQQVARRLGARLRGPTRLPAPYENAAVDLWAQTRADWVARR